MSSVLVTGANRGIGLALAEGYARRGWTVWAAARTSACESITAIEGDVRPIALDLADSTSIDSLPRRMGQPAIDLQINCAGLLGLARPLQDPADTDDWPTIFQVNVIGTLRLTLAMLPLISRGKERKIVTLTSRWGSIGENDVGGKAPYRASKAALNSALHNLSIEVADRGIALLIITPGWVRTDMGGPDAPISSEERAEDLISLLPQLGNAHSGRFLNYDGQELPW
jgi:NAD(P)-dependent dehydrogenase (short-subunit alcohol dehydrogenase family)